jgi:uncharacterized 2Fe-2S/4Fe-4S cluster protein (DUF4445 family)
MLSTLPYLLQKGAYRGTAVIAGDELLDFFPGVSSVPLFGLAVDVGTTTLVAALYDLADGTLKGQQSCINPQTSFGDDVLSRIAFAGNGPEALAEVQRDVVEAINALIEQLTAETGIEYETIYGLTCSGNTTMQHLLAGIDPSSLGQVPFTPVVDDAMDMPAAALGLRIHPRGRVYILPVIGGFVGGDTVSGLLVTDVLKSDAPILFVDIGTNGEIVLNHNGASIATSCAAGPAFEGARIAHGMRAANGAIESVRIENDIHCSVIGGGKPIGLCGSGLIDLVAELLEVELLLPEGMLPTTEQAPVHVPVALRNRLDVFEDGVAFRVASAEETETGRPIHLHLKDIRQLQLACAAVRAGIAIMLQRAGLTVADLGGVRVAGAFGNYVRCESAQRIGLLPAELTRDRFAFVGNTSLAGACLCTLSNAARAEAGRAARNIEHLDLSLDPGFQETFVDAMFFPQTTG